ncbi:MAG: TadE/TadG family type IV pilus assembly protein [Parvularculaceae bacterium]
MRRRSDVRRFLRNRDGAQAVEFALVAPVLIAFLFGTFEIGRVMYTESKVAEAASAGARAATVYNKASSAYTSAESTKVSDEVKNRFDASDRSLVQVNFSDTTFGTQNFVKIDVTYTFSFLVHFGPFASPVTISTTRYSPYL